MDTTILPQDQSFGQKSSKESSLLNYSKMPLPRRATILWDKSLEDVIEDKDGEMEEQHNMSKEAAEEKYEEKVLIGKEEYMVCNKLL